MKWFFIDESITDGDRRQGPYSIGEIRDFVNTGKIVDETLVWHAGMESWISWKETDEAKLEANRDEILQNTINAILREKLKEKHYASFMLRAAAFMIDNIILGIAGVLFLLIFVAAGWIDYDLVQAASNEYANNLFSAEALQKFLETPGMGSFMSVWSFVQALYFIVMHAKFSATVGKMIFHIHVENANGERLSWAGSMVRYIASIFTQLTTMFYGLGYLIAIVDPKHRALHDWIARTFVVTDIRIKIKERSSEEQEN